MAENMARRKRRDARNAADPIRRARKRLRNTERYYADIEKARESRRRSVAAVRARQRAKELATMHPLVRTIILHEDGELPEEAA